MRLLVIEDDLKIANSIAGSLTEAGYRVDVARDGEQGLELASSNEYSILILDLMLPHRDGLSVLSELRTRGVTTKTIILSAKHHVDDRVLGLQSGGDDYMTKPFATSELLARCSALMRRNMPPILETQFSVGDITLDLLSREVHRGEKLIELQVREFALLEFFIRNPEKILTKSQILARVWHYNFDPQTNVVDVLVCRLRNKLDRDFKDKTIHTIRGVGYVFRF